MHGSHDMVRLRGPSIVVLVVAGACSTSPPEAPRPEAQPYEYKETRALVALVDDAARLIESDGEAAFPELRRPDSRWRHQDSYVFVLDPGGTMLVHPDPALEGKVTLDLKDVAGRPIIRGLLEAATAVPDKPDGWYHYQWPVPGELLPRWKSSYVRLVTAPSGKRYIVGSGMYDDRMERAFVVDMVTNAVGTIEHDGQAAFPLLRDPTGPFLAKDAYVFVIAPDGVALVHPAFPNLEGKNLLDVKDTQGKPMIRDMLELVRTRGSGWVDYMWPRPGESVSTRKSTYVTRANIGGSWGLVGAGVYLADAPKLAPATPPLTAPELMALVRDGAAMLAQRGDAAYLELRTKGTRWFHDDTYFFVWNLDGVRSFHAADPSLEGKDARGAKDVLGRPYGQMILDIGASPSGEGWVHYEYPTPGNLFPVWKSTFVKRVRFPSGEERIVGAGVYNMQMDKAFIVDLVDRAAALVEARGDAAFPALRDRTGPFRFMDVYVFVDTPEGTELVNPGQPTLERRNIMNLTDARGRTIAREYITAAVKRGSAWIEYDWYKPGTNTLAHKQAYVRRVQVGPNTYVIGSGFYVMQPG